MKRIALLLAFTLLLALPASGQINLPTPSGATAAITAIASGTTGTVTATLPGAAGKTTFLCGFDISAAGGSATISPVTITGLVGGTFTYQDLAAGASAPFQHAFWPCVPSSTVNTAISINTTADGTATAVNVQAWGFQQ